MTSRWRIFWIAYGALLTAAFAIAFVAMWLAPQNRPEGPVEKLRYLHLPSAINAFAGCLIVFIGGIGYLWQRRLAWDDLAAAGAKLAVVGCSIVLVTGMIWGHKAWGKWWTWSPRLTFSLLLWLLYVVYLLIRPSIESRQQRAVVSAVYGIAAFLDVPLVYLSARLLPDYIHPRSLPLDAAMKVTLAIWFVPITLAAAGLVLLDFRASGRRRSRRRQRQQQIDAAWEGTPQRETSHSGDPEGETHGLHPVSGRRS